MQVTSVVELLRRPAVGDEPAGWLARIGAEVFPIDGYAIGSGEDGDGIAHVTLDVPATSVRIGGQLPAGAHPVTSVAARPVAERGPRLPWGVPGSDPREAIPGWKPEPSIAEQAAANAAARAEVHP